MPDLNLELENTQRYALQLQIENAQLKLQILDLRKENTALKQATAQTSEAEAQ